MDNAQSAWKVGDVKYHQGQSATLEFQACPQILHSRLYRLNTVYFIEILGLTSQIDKVTNERLGVAASWLL